MDSLRDSNEAMPQTNEWAAAGRKSFSRGSLIPRSRNSPAAGHSGDSAS